MLLMFLLLSISIVGHSSGQFLASGAVRVEDLSIIGARTLIPMQVYSSINTYECIHAHTATNSLFTFSLTCPQWCVCDATSLD